MFDFWSQRKSKLGLKIDTQGEYTSMVSTSDYFPVVLLVYCSVEEQSELH